MRGPLPSAYSATRDQSELKKRTVCGTTKTHMLSHTSDNGNAIREPDRRAQGTAVDRVTTGGGDGLIWILVCECVPLVYVVGLWWCCGMEG
jgi:hypothetical protein